MVAQLKARRDRLVSRLNDIPGIRCFSPRGTFHVYPDVTELMARKSFADYEAFRQAILRDTGVAVCTRQHFGRPLPNETARHIRLAFGGVAHEQIDEGLDRLAAWSA
jgi:aspartate/methionine/tyrosine aminotransferase